MDLGACSTDVLLQLREQIAIFKHIWWIVHQGELYRLWSPFESSRAAWMYVSRDKRTAVVFAFSVNSDHWSNIVPLLKLQGLLPDAEYVVSEPLPNDMSQTTGYVRQLESESKGLLCCGC
jgi:alpha-galactosidase